MLKNGQCFVSEPDDEDIIQIIPADGWWVRYAMDDGTKCISKIACIALRRDGVVRFLDAAGNGEIDDLGSNVQEVFCDAQLTKDWVDRFNQSEFSKIDPATGKKRLFEEDNQ